MSEAVAAVATSGEELNLKILWTLARWIEDTHGKDKLDEIATAAGLDAKNFDAQTRWTTWEKCEKFLAGARALAPDEETFRKASGHRFHESFGAVRYMVWSLSEQQFFEAAVKMSKLMVKISHFEQLLSKASEFHVRYISDKPESRAMCLSRQASWVYGPTMWDMPPAQLTEKACIANGDPYCEYHLKWFARRRLMPIVIGIAVGGAAAFAVSQTGAHVPAEIAFPVLGAAVAYILELRRAQGTNLKLAEDMNQVLRDLGQAEAEARSELSALDRRQEEWTKLMEEQMAARTMTLEKVVDGLELLQSTRATTLKGFSHDLRNPLFVLKGNVQYLLEKLASGNVSLADEKETLTDMEAASAQMEGMLGSLMDVAVQGPGQLKLAPKPMITAPLADLFRRRLRALVYGRDIKVSSFASREMPEKIVVDPLVFDRIVDNLLTNAAKYTKRGSIVLELSGTTATGDSPSYFTLKVSDTGEGIAPENVERIFRPRTADEPKRPNSYGVGLSSVVQLMAQIGGKIDVMSRPGAGSTFWAHLPVDMLKPKKPESSGETESLDDIIHRVVTVRKAEGP